MKSPFLFDFGESIVSRLSSRVLFVIHNGGLVVSSSATLSGLYSFGYGMGL